MIELPNVTALYVFLAFGICYWILKKYLFVPLSAILDGRMNAEAGHVLGMSVMFHARDNSERVRQAHPVNEEQLWISATRSPC